MEDRHEWGRDALWMQWRMAMGFRRAPGPTVSLVFLMAVFRGTIAFSEGGASGAVTGGNSAEGELLPLSRKSASDGI